MNKARNINELYRLATQLHLYKAGARARKRARAPEHSLLALTWNK